MDQYPVGGLALAAVAGNGIAIVQVGMFADIEFDSLPGVGLDSYVAVAVDLGNRSQFAVGNIQLAGRRSKLHAVAFGEFALGFTVDGDALQPARIIAQLASVLAFDGQLVFPAIDAGHGCIFTGLDAKHFAASGVTQHITGLILFSPSPVSAGEALARFQYSD